MSQRAAALMDSIRAEAQAKKRELESKKPPDTVYTVITNVGAMHKQAKTALKDVRRDLNEGPSAAKDKYVWMFVMMTLICCL